jgi:hypothetical protein
VAASIGADGVVAVITDVSAPMTSDQWARAAVELALDVGASEISIEAYSARETYQRVAKDALKRYKIDRPIKVSAWPPKGSGRGGGDSIARSSALIQGFEVGTVLLAGHHLELEEAAVQWQQGQHQPDCLAALVVAHDVLIHAVGQIWNSSARSTWRSDAARWNAIPLAAAGSPAGLDRETCPRLIRGFGSGYRATRITR